MRNELPTLHELQMQLRRAVLDGAGAEIASLFEADGLDPAARLEIYRNHAVATLSATLATTFPVVCRLVDQRFFAYVAHEYLREHPPHSRCLTEYGRDFADFIGGFEPCRGLPYLADVARFEWALNTTATRAATPPLRIEALAAVPAEKAAYLRLQLQPSVAYLASSWPVHTIWQAHQESETPPIHLTSGGVGLEIRRSGEGAAWRRLDPPSFVFRQSLADGLVLAAAIAAAEQMDAGFGVAFALRQIFADGLVIGFCIMPE